MTTEDYVSYPLALALKKAGFDWKCHYHYDSDRGSHIIEPNYTANDGEDCQYITTDDLLEDNNGWQYCSAPSLAQAQKWLRDIFLLHVGANPALPTRKWQFYIDDLNQQINPYDGELMTRWDDDMQEKADEHLHDTYESALSAGIAAALELIDNEKE